MALLNNNVPENTFSLAQNAAVRKLVETRYIRNIYAQGTVWRRRHLMRIK